MLILVWVHNKALLNQDMKIKIEQYQIFVIQ